MSASQHPHRPGSWAIYGHEWAVRLLQRVIPSTQHDQTLPPRYGPRHAYLFLGSAQIGKTTLARSFAAALLCTGDQPPCGTCRSCSLLAHGNHPDFHLVQPLDRDGGVDRANGLLRAEQAAELIHAAALRPLEGRYRIFLLQDAHLANDTFANKLLKTL
ncbi:MAG: hypothetical protein HC802_21110, partial [Caldilineaceae bacterium]|nr:hypothetical protein [Caldilineaceae bacterium]